MPLKLTLIIFGIVSKLRFAAAKFRLFNSEALAILAIVHRGLDDPPGVVR